VLRRIELDPSPVSPGSTLRPIARFEAGQASVVLGRAEIFEREPVEYAVARLSCSGAQDDAVAVVTAAAAAADGPVYLPVNAVSGVDHAARCELAQACGFELFQEKEEFLWTDDGQAVPEPSLRLTAMARIGRAPFVPLIARCVAQTLDRTDAVVVARHRPDEWVTTFLDHRATGADTESWLYAETPDGVPCGFVGLAQSDPGVGTIVLIGVVPDQRGHRYVDHLVRTAYRASRRRGFTAVRSLVDVVNHPMMAAMRRSGADPSATAWHKWLYVKGC
jgi:ribosomal protein S18 acetylase RimI-like enzyme